MNNAKAQNYVNSGTNTPPGKTRPLSHAISLAVLATAATLHSNVGFAGSCSSPNHIPPNAFSTCSGGINAADVTQDLNITALPNGTTLTIETTADFAIDASAGDAISINATGIDQSIRFDGSNSDQVDGDIIGQGIGIAAYARNQVSITTNGVVSGRSLYGIVALSTYPQGTTGNTNVEVEVDARNDVTGDVFGIYAYVDNTRSGSPSSGIDIEVTTTGNVTGTSDNGMSIYGYYVDTITVNAEGNVTGGSYGMEVRQDYSGGMATPDQPNGSTSITTSGSVTGGDSGISVSHGSHGTVAITAQAPDPMNVPTIEGQNFRGIYSYSSDSTAGSTLTIGAHVIGADSGIRAIEHADASVTITVQAGGSVTGDPGPAIVNTDSDSDVTIEAGANITGDIELGQGADALTFGAVNFTMMTGLGQLNGDADDAGDVLTFEGSSGTLEGSQVTSGWQTIELINNANVTLNDGTVLVTTVDVENGSTLGLTGAAFTLDGDLNNDGAVSLVDNAADDTVTVTGDYAANSELHLDAVLDDGTGGADSVIFQGNVTGETEVFINNVTPGLGAETVAPGIPLIRTGNVSGTFVLGAEVRDGDHLYELVRVADGSDFVWHLQSSFSLGPTPAEGAEEIPTLGAWAIAALSSLMVGLGGWFSRRKRRRVA